MVDEGTPRVLFLTHTAPLPPVSGERIRSFNLMRQLALKGWRVSVYALDHGVKASPRDRRSLEEFCQDVIFRPFDEQRARRGRRLLMSLLLRRPFQSKLFFDAEVAKDLAAWLQERRFDVLVAGQLYMYPYVPPALRRRTVLDAHNVELWRVESMAAAKRRTPRGLAARAQRGSVAQYEQEAAESVARILAVSRDDVRYFEALAPGRVELVPNGVDCESYRPRKVVPAEPTLLFVGSLDYAPNADAVAYLVREVLPRVRDLRAQVTIAGSNPGRNVYRNAARSGLRIEVLGYVEDARPQFEAARIFIVPLRFGAGTRIKILEALAQGIPVVTTTIGCSGLDLVHGRDLLIADEPRDFAASIDRLLEDDELCARLGQSGRATVECTYDWDAIGGTLDSVLRSALHGAD